MKIKRLFAVSFASVALAALSLVGLNSCSSEAEGLVEKIPADATYVMKFNLAQVIENSGCTVENGAIKLSSALQETVKEMGGTAAVAMAQSWLDKFEGLDLSAFILFANSFDEDDVYGLAQMTDPEAVKSTISGMVGSPQEISGYDVYDMDDVLLCIDGQYIWIAESVDKVKVIEALAKDKNIGSKPGLKDLLLQDNAFAIAVNLPACVEAENQRQTKWRKSWGEDKPFDLEENIREELEDEVAPSLVDKITGILDDYACISMKFDGNVVSGEAYLMAEDGTRNPLGEMVGEIDTDFLANVPESSTFVAVMGQITDPDLQKLFKQASYYMEGYGDLLTDVNGTAAWAAGLNCPPMQLVNTLIQARSDKDMMKALLAHFESTVMVHYPESTITKYASMIGVLLQQSEMNYTSIGDDQYQVTLPVDGQYITSYFGNNNGYFTFSNVPFSKVGNGSLASHFEGRRAVMFGYSEPGQYSDLGVDFGNESTMWLEADAIKFETKLTGTDKCFIEAYIDMVCNPKFQESMMAIFDQIEDRYSYDDYDYSDYSYEYADTAVVADADIMAYDY